MTLKELISFLEKRDPNKIIPLGFNYPHSYKGYYRQLAFAPAPNISIGEMLECAKSSIDATFSGPKGGEYTMGEYTDVWLAEPGCLGEGIGPILLKYMMGERP